MATLEHLEGTGVLIRHVPDLEHWEMPKRCITYSPDFGIWQDEVLSVAKRKRGRNLSPYDQVEQIFYDFVIGTPMAYSVNYRKLEPHGHHIWELKTEDVRVFGWFVRKSHFVAVLGELKDNIPAAKYYKPYIKCTKKFRDNLDLDQPKEIRGVTHAEIF